MGVITLNSLRLGAGIDSALLDEAIKIAREKSCPRIWLAMTNDNTTAIDFYKARGFNVAGIHKNAVIGLRQLKPEIPLFGVDRAPIRNEVQMEILLSQKT
ncbi:GNAT family N-acetyltransferase [Candidatus Thorarchaeota archaeon]|nr:MAG: GNAT family N-acetyltransferase [Candidatus Thorarchaeota archaeon]